MGLFFVMVRHFKWVFFYVLCINLLALCGFLSELRGCVCFVFLNDEGMVDYQHVIPAHADVARRKNVMS